MPAKRKSSGGGSPAPPKAIKATTELHVPVDALLKDQVKVFDQWLSLGGNRRRGVLQLLTVCFLFVRVRV